MFFECKFEESKLCNMCGDEKYVICTTYACKVVVVVVVEFVHMEQDRNLEQLDIKETSFRWPDVVKPFTTPLDGRGLQVETYTQAQERRRRRLPLPPIFDGIGIKKDSSDMVFFAYDEENTKRLGKPKALWIGRVKEDGSYMGQISWPPKLRSPEGKTLRIEYVYDESGRVKAKRLIPDSTPGL